MFDNTPFKTRTTLLTTYQHNIEAFRRGENPFPVLLEVNLCGSCSQDCNWCISKNTHGPYNQQFNLKLDDPGVKRFLNDFSRLGGKAVNWSGGGEPTYHPYFNQALKIANSAGLQQGLFTHGVFSRDLIEPISDHCQWVRISIDTHNPTNYANRRHTTDKAFKNLIENIGELVSLGKTRVGLNINVSEWNKKDIEPLFNLARELKVAYLQVRPTLPTPFMRCNDDNFLNVNSVDRIYFDLRQILATRGSDDPELIFSHEKFHDFHHLYGNRQDPDWGYSGCAAYNLVVVLNYNGNLMVCMYHLADYRFILGNIYGDNTLEKIWENCGEVRNFCKEFDNKICCQVCCKGHEINKILLSEKGKKLELQDNSNPSTTNVFF